MAGAAVLVFRAPVVVVMMVLLLFLTKAEVAVAGIAFFKVLKVEPMSS